MVLDDTFHYYPNCSKLINIINEDNISDLKISEKYIQINAKLEAFYNFFWKIIKFIKNNNKFEFKKIVAIYTDTEITLAIVIKNFFPNSLRIIVFLLSSLFIKNQKKYLQI